MDKSKEELIKELNQLSDNFEKNKQRMIEIAKILLAEHFNWKTTNKWDVKDAEWK